MLMPFRNLFAPPFVGRVAREFFEKSRKIKYVGKAAKLRDFAYRARLAAFFMPVARAAVGKQIFCPPDPQRVYVFYGRYAVSLYKKTAEIRFGNPAKRGEFRAVNPLFGIVPVNIFLGGRKQPFVRRGGISVAVF